MTDFEDIMALRGASNEEPEKTLEEQIRARNIKSWAPIQTYNSEGEVIEWSSSPLEMDLGRYYGIRLAHTRNFYEVPLSAVTVQGPRSMEHMVELLSGIAVCSGQTVTINFTAPSSYLAGTPLTLRIEADTVPSLTRPVYGFDFGCNIRTQSGIDLREEIIANMQEGSSSIRFELFMQPLPVNVARGDQFLCVGTLRATSRRSSPIGIQRVVLQIDQA